MKRIVRLTESDLTRIVRRVINEQARKSIVDAGYSSDMAQFAVAYGDPTVTKGDSNGTKVSFSGMVFKNTTSEVKNEGTIVLYGSCKRNNNPGFLSPRSVYDVETGGSGYIFDQGGKIDAAARAFCENNYKVKPIGGKDADYITWAKKEMTKLPTK